MREGGGEGKDGRMSPIQRSPGDVQEHRRRTASQEKEAAELRPRTPRSPPRWDPGESDEIRPGVPDDDPDSKPDLVEPHIIT
jgi:hypothetical protein